MERRINQGIIYFKMQQIENKNSNQHIRDIVDKYSALLFRISYCVLCNKDDAEDAVQEALLKYLTKAPAFKDEEHEKAWLIKVVANISKNIFMFRLRQGAISLDELKNIGINDEDSEIFELILGLPSKYKVVLTLHYVEGYKTKEIASILSVSEDLVRKRLQKGRDLLKKEFERCERL